MAPLFAYGDIHEELNDRRTQALTNIKHAPSEFVLSADPTAWSDALIRANQAEAPSLHLERLGMSQPVEIEIQTNPPGVVGGIVSYGGQSHRVPGEQVDLHIGVDGEADLMRLKLSNVRGLPRVEGRIAGDVLVHTLRYKATERPNLRAEAVRFVQDLQSHLGHLRRFVEDHNTRLEREVRAAVHDRRKRSAERRKWVEGQNLPIIEEGAPSEQRTLSIERRTPPSAHGAAGPSTSPDLALADEDYEYVLGVISAKARSMERMGGNYASWDEPALRDDLIAVLNTHYPGGASGETFNKGGEDRHHREGRRCERLHRRMQVVERRRPDAR